MCKSLCLGIVLLAETVSASEVRLSSFSPAADGKTDDTGALQALFSAARKGKARRVIIEPGVYFVNRGNVALCGNCTVEAEGAEFVFPRKLGEREQRVMFKGVDLTNFRWQGGFFRGYVYDPTRAENTWEPSTLTRGILLVTSAAGRTDSVFFSGLRGRDVGGAVLSVMGSEAKTTTNFAQRVDVRDCSFVRCGKFMWDYGFLWERLTFPDRFPADQVALAKRYDDEAEPVEKRFWRWNPIGGGPGKGGLDLWRCRYAVVSGCRLDACGDAMHIGECQDVVFSGNQVTGARMGAFYIGNFCQRVSVTGNTVDGTNGSRIMSVETCSQDITIVGNVFANGGRGSWINQPKNIVIANNIFVRNTLKCTPKENVGRLTYHAHGGYERYPEIYFTTVNPRGTYGPVIMKDNVFTLSSDASLAVAFRNGGRNIRFDGNAFTGAVKDIYVGEHCEMPEISGNIGLGKVVRTIGDAQSGGGLPEDRWSGK